MGSFTESLKEFFGFSEEDVIEHPKINMAPPVTPTEEPVKNTPKSFKASLVNTQNATPFPASEIKVEEPRIYEDSLNIATQLRENKPVILNLKYLDPETSKRLVDFICGTAYAINGHMMKIGENIFLFTPANIFIANTDDKTTFEQGVQEQEKNLFLDQVSGIQ